MTELTGGIAMVSPGGRTCTSCFDGIGPCLFIFLRVVARLGTPF
jgi:hypothetical protein